MIEAIAAVPRERFVPGELQRRAWENVALPIECGQSISQPLVVARMAELLAPEPEDRVLDVGTGTGYHAAVLARLAAHVWSIERHPELAARAHETLAALGIANVTVLAGDGTRGHPDAAPYDAINVAAAARDGVPPALLRQLAEGGRLVAPIESGGDQRLVLVCRTAEGLTAVPYEPVRFVPLVDDEGHG